MGKKNTLPICKKGRGNPKKKKKTYNTGDSLVVTDPTTNPALSGLTRGERTGSRAFQMVWSYVVEDASIASYISKFFNGGGLY